MIEKDSGKIIKSFTEVGIKILEADYGYARWKSINSDTFKLAYKSSNTPFEPPPSKKISNHYKAIKTKKLIFETKIEKENYRLPRFDITPYMKSFIIIPIYHKKDIYGSLTLCYKKQKDFFNEEELALAQTIGHTTAQAITIHRLIETDILLEEERQKTEFIANAVHEFRTPLAIMRGNVELALWDKHLTVPKARKSLTAANKEVLHLSALLMDFAVLTNPKRYQKDIIHPAEVDIAKLIKKIATRVKVLLMRKRKVSLTIRAKGQTIISGDAKYLEKLFINLIRNAIIYSKENGHVVVDITQRKDAVVIQVTDDGIGISKQELPRVFDRFFRSEKARATTNIGTGIGLSLAKWVAESHGGTLDVKSIEGKGSTFTVTLPLSV